MKISILNQTEAWVIALLLFILMITACLAGKLKGNYIRTIKMQAKKRLKLPGFWHCFFLTGVYIWDER